jgi:LmbE family N-acetylglucosaminyl deacetylase
LISKVKYILINNKGEAMKPISKKELEDLYRNNTNDDACKILGVSKVTFLSYLKKAGIQLKGKGNNRKYEIGN